MYKIKSLIITAILLFVCSSSLIAQSPEEILDEMIEQYTSSIADVETMMMITRMEGFMESEPDTTYYRKVVTDGFPNMQAVSSGSEAPATNYYNIQENYDALVENATYEGTETVNGRRAHVLFIEDVSALYNDMVTTPEGQEQQQQAEPQSGRMYIDAEDYIPLRMSFDINYDEEYTGTADIVMSDIRNVDGMMIPFQMEMQIDGISSSMSAEDMAQAKESMAQFEEQMKNASGLQKRIMEQTLKPQMERLQKILEEGSMTMRTIVMDVQTNVTIPE
ncbi:outer membrane lipoprotein-sorting protein [Rhodohalobacter sp. 614A]|uniref:outer membrane lipoprotein-sorting protein n=1 Tax=Rhodohalobacter sp. 614A TaxID=2908649 RepID=UPI001F15E69C|nr:outer membrane lipoprotein-sorting protein [Rhodohalobacter sp. 614A]